MAEQKNVNKETSGIVISTEHSIKLDNKKSARISGVKEILCAEDSSVLLKTTMGKMSVLGSVLRVKNLNLEEGTLLIEGEISGIKYFAGSSKGFFKKMFK